MFLKTKNSGLTYKVLVFLSLYLGVAGLSYGQTTNWMSNSYDKNHSETTTRSYNPDSHYSMKLRDVPLKKALQMISREAGLILTYRSGLFLSPKEVSLDLNNIKVEETLDKILGDTEIEYKITETRHLIVYRERNLGHIQGDILGATSSDPLQGAKVFLVKSEDISGLGIKYHEAKKSTFVSSSGRYNISNVEPGTYRLIVIDKGHKKIYKKVHIDSNETKTQNFRLKYPRN